MSHQGAGNYCQARVDGLTLHFGTGRTQELNDEQCVSACEEDTCFEADYDGPWPSVFYSESFTIAIP